MEWLIVALAGLAIGPLIFWLALWAPHQIEHEEAVWLKESLGVNREIQFDKPAAPWHSDFWRSYWRKPLFLICMIAAPAIAIAFWHRFDGSPNQLLMVFFGLAMLGLAISDQYSQYLPDNMTLTLMWIGFLAQFSQTSQTVGLQASVLGAAVGYAALWLIGKGFALVRKQDGLGHGDMKLMAAAGAWLGIEPLPLSIVIGSFLAIAVQGSKILTGKSRKQDLFAFGPWLAAGVTLTALVKL